MRKIFGLTAVAISLVIAGGTALAQIPEGVPSDVTIPGGPEIPAAPSGDLGPAIEKPGVPGIPSEARAAIPDDDFVEIYCLMTKWKTGAFFAALDAIDRHLLPATREAAAIVGALSVPDTAAIRTETDNRIGNVCGATGVEAADSAVNDLAAYGESVRAQFAGLRDEMSSKLKTEGDALRARIEKRVESLVATEKAAAEAELNALGERLGAEAQSGLEREVAGKSFSSGEEAQAYVQGRMNAVRAGITSQVQAKADELKKGIESRIRADIDGYVGPEKRKFEELGKTLGSLGDAIDAAVVSGQAQYERYRTEAFAKRKSLALGFVDQSVARAAAELEQNRGQIESARQEDPGIKTVEAIIEEMNTDRNALAAQLDKALETGNEAAFQAAIDAFRSKWENYRSEAERSFSSVNAICQKATERIAAARTRLSDGTREISDLRDRCAGTVSQECLRANSLAPRFDTLLSKMEEGGDRLSAVENACRNEAATDTETLTGLLGAIKTAGDELDVYGQSMQAEKSKLMADSVADICGQVLPQLKAARVELRDDDLAGLEDSLNRCKGSRTEECAAVNGTSGDFAALKSEIAAFLADADRMDKACAQAPSEEQFLEVRDLATYLKSSGENLKTLSKDLRLKQSEEANQKTVCSAVTPRFDIARKEIAQGVADASSTLAGCRDQTDGRCAAINASAGRLADITAKAEDVMKRIDAVAASCKDATDETAADGAFLGELESIRSEEAAIKLLVFELKAETGSVWPERIKSGRPFKVVLDVAPSIFDDSAWTGNWRTDQMGTIKGGETYTLTYKPGSWAASGFNEGTGRTGTWTYRYGDPDAHQIDLWGRVFKFDKEGLVYDQDYGLVGHLSE